MTRAGYIVGTMVAAAAIGAIFGLVWGFFAQEAGWWGAWGLFGLIVGIVGGVMVADRAVA
ncbi:MAG: hypothetical protein ACRDJE_17225 [Dehalococcoidia bacterium]